ncbi:angiopoietin-1-like [Anopheles darlingi]|uniref:angiopoietin-1-like n=1 Tax=Anopheles darlingi TaxID=43151 RepID=UPI0021005F96|nr:angiopoietin-1-like [Anopheles darlingi]
MKQLVCYLILCAVLCVKASDVVHKTKNDAVPSRGGTMGIGFELILTKLDWIANKLQKLENKLERMEHQFNEHHSSQEHINKKVFAAFDKLENQVTFDLSETQNRTQEKILTALENVENQIGRNLTDFKKGNQEQVHAVLHKMDRDVGRVLQNQDTFSSCKDVPSNVSGTYWIHLELDSKTFKVYCEQEAHDGGWIVIQHRYDGSLDFYRNWNEFRDGFGDLNKEFWLGLEKVYRITKRCKHELFVELKDYNGTYKYARYDAFEVGSEGEQYILKAVGKWRGTTGDEMRYHKGNKFSTKDRDNDENSGKHCAQFREGAWWHYTCYDVNLNASDVVHETKNATPSTGGTMGLELILTKLDLMASKLQKVENKLESSENKFDRMENKLENMEKQLNEHRSSLDHVKKDIFAALDKLENQFAFKLIETQNRTQQKILTALRKDSVKLSEFQNGIQEKVHPILHKLDRDVGRVLQNQYSHSAFSSCKNVPSNVSGTYWIHLELDSKTFKVYCEQEAHDGGWIVIQHRYDGSLDFYRNWNEFRDGFGDLNKEFWLGLENIHQITKRLLKFNILDCLRRLINT